MKARLFGVIALLLFAVSQLMAAAEDRPTPAQARITAAEQAIEKDPENYLAYNELALALARRAREISDVTYYKKADEALAKSFEISPNNFEGQRVAVWILLGKHEFAKARDAARELNRLMPDDLLVYGFLADANVELGNYKEAEEAAQWMLDMRPGNVPGLTRGAYLRELFGDIEGALEFMMQAFQRTPVQEREDRAWILTQAAHLELQRGQPDAADKLLQAAFDLFPSYHYSLVNLARVRTAQGRYSEAIEPLRKLIETAPYPENMYLLAEAQQRAGQTEDAARTFTEFERKALLEVDWADNSNRELIFYYADHADNPQEALRIAEKEYARRHDAFTLDAYAWALHVNGRCQEARQQIEVALAVGVHDARLLYHAGVIASKLDDAAAARMYFEKALRVNPVSEYSQATQDALEKIDPMRAGL